jgi:hypothetical protein
VLWSWTAKRAPGLAHGMRSLRTTCERQPARDRSPSRSCIREKQQRRTDCSYPCNSGAAAVISRTRGAFLLSFSKASAAKIAGLLARIEESEGPPAGVATTGLKMLYDEGQGTAVVLQYFATAQDMDAGAQAFSAMDAGRDAGHGRVRRHVRGQA